MPARAADGEGASAAGPTQTCRDARVTMPPMPAPTTSPDRAGAACWACGAPARDDCAYVFVLVAPSRRVLDARGYPATRGRRLDKVRVRVPRCASCQAQSRLGIAIVLGGSAVGAIVATILQAAVWPDVAAPSWLRVSHEGIGNTGTGIGAVLGFVAGLLAAFLLRRRAGLRSLTSYPPIRMLRREGWQYPSD